MKFIILSLRDIKAGFFLPPIFVTNQFAAQRDLADQINGQQKQEPWQKHPEDFELWKLGEWDAKNAAFEVQHDGSQTQPECICSLTTMVNRLS